MVEILLGSPYPPMYAKKIPPPVVQTLQSTDVVGKCVSGTFDTSDRSAQSFLHGCTNPSKVIFGRVTQTLGTYGSSPDPEKWVSRQIYFLPGFCGRGS